MTHTDKQPENTTNWQDTDGGGRMQLCEDTLKETFPCTDKQPQTCYVPVKDVTRIVICDPEKRFNNCATKLDSVYIHTPEELEALKRESAEEALSWFINMQDTFGKLKDIDVDAYLNQHYPLPQPINNSSYGN